jgi:hypothetical protein
MPLKKKLVWSKRLSAMDRLFRLANDFIDQKHRFPVRNELLDLFGVHRVKIHAGQTGFLGTYWKILEDTRSNDNGKLRDDLLELCRDVSTRLCGTRSR